MTDAASRIGYSLQKLGEQSPFVSRQPAPKYTFAAFFVAPPSTGSSRFAALSACSTSVSCEPSRQQTPSPMQR